MVLYGDKINQLKFQDSTFKYLNTKTHFISMRGQGRTDNLEPTGTNKLLSSFIYLLNTQLSWDE